MTTTPASRIIGTVTVRAADGTTRTVHRWSTWERDGDAWHEDGMPILKTAEGRIMCDLGDGTYVEDGTNVAYHAVCSGR